jgi:hypothetical protein
MQRVQHVSADQSTAEGRFWRLRHTVLYRLDGPWLMPAWRTLDDIVRGADGSLQLPGRTTGIMVATLANARLVYEGPEVCLDGACMYRVKTYALTDAGHVALAHSFARGEQLWTAEDTAEARKRAAKRPKLT